jgi:hypothetical protein
VICEQKIVLADLADPADFFSGFAFEYPNTYLTCKLTASIKYMKSGIIISGFFLFLAFVSCRKDESIPDYCYHIVHSSPDSAILSDEDLALILPLFVANNLDYSNYQFYSFAHDEFGNYHIASFPYINGFKIFHGFLAFHFDSSGMLTSMNGDTISSISLDTIPAMDPRVAIKLYIQELNRDQTYPHSKEEIKYGCFDVEFGYYDLNSANGTEVRNFTKAWKVTPEGRDFPYAYVNDMTSKLIYYSNGIIIN